MHAHTSRRDGKWMSAKRSEPASKRNWRRVLAKYSIGRRTPLVTVAKNGGGVGVAVDCTRAPSSGISLQSEGHGGDAHSAFDDALVLEKRVRRYKRRLRNHRGLTNRPFPAEGVSGLCARPWRMKTRLT